MRPVVVLAVLAFAAMGSVVAQDDQEPARAVPARAARHPLTGMPESSFEVVTHYALVGNADMSAIPIGEMTKLVVGLINKGTSDVNVTGIMGSLNNQYQFDMYFQNFTAKPIGEVVPAGEEGSFEYILYPAPELEPLDYQIAVTIFYNDLDDPYATTFFNHTVTLVDNSPVLDLRTALQYFVFLAVGGVLGFVLLCKSPNSGSKSSSLETGTRNSNAGSFTEEFLKRNEASGGRVGKANRRRRNLARQASRAADASR